MRQPLTMRRSVVRVTVVGMRHEGGILRALEGVLVVDFSQVIAGAYCTQILADLGATVIKIEKPSGDDTRGMTGTDGGDPDASPAFSMMNRNKQGIVIDIRSAEGQNVARRLLENADILVENFRPGTLAKYGLGYEQLKSAFPRLVYCTISGYGTTGPLATWAGYDLVGQGYSGLMSLTGEPGRGPMKIGVPICDIAAGAFASNAVLAAYIHAQRTGFGQFVESSLLEAGTAFTVWEAALLYGEGVSATQTGTAHRLSAPYQAYETADGWINVGAANQKSFVKLAENLEMPDLLDDPRFCVNSARMKNLRSLNDKLAKRFATRPTDQWVAELSAAGIPCGPVLDIDNALSSPQAQARNIVVEGEHPLMGEVKYLNTPFKMSQTPPKIERPAPLLGQHTSRVLTDAGYSEQQIEELMISGVVAQSSRDMAL